MLIKIVNQPINHFPGNQRLIAEHYDQAMGYFQGFQNGIYAALNGKRHPPFRILRLQNDTGFSNTFCPL
ncbi:hypothetical protein D3C77_767960 [compost metagenome]